ncbi:conserved hypothetical protein [Halorhabdus utahensis DSM 12940]|uniref:Uncharacterized protein n=1 Tax=Halorhabdus utahensis (strain DSM 12940 / JCM 11049 / AX-2) TaxID=519442 RepID=C7NVF0_HALUD|nr:hypothetical protein [Halorhabdus utahensis]ACV11234.1 conserved hypothetical protein [Halorhabdus utahensis DSM 12940]
MSQGARGGGPPINVTTEFEDGRTVVTVTGNRNVAVVVNSVSGERVYLPPEEGEHDGEPSPYRPTGDSDSATAGSSGDSPYEGIQDDSPYGSRRQPDVALGVNPTADGFRVVHPEPADDVRILR